MGTLYNLCFSCVMVFRIYIFNILSILLDLLVCLIYALVLIWLGLEFGLAWKNSGNVGVPGLLGQHSRMLLIFLRGSQDLFLGLFFIVKSFYLWLLYVNGTFFVSTGHSMGSYSRARYKFMCYVLYML